MPNDSGLAEKPHVVRFYLYQTPRMAKFRENSGFQGWEKGRIECNEISFLGYENALGLGSDKSHKYEPKNSALFTAKKKF